MFFMALASSYIVRKGLGMDWQSTTLPPVLWFNTAILLASSVTIMVARKTAAHGAHLAGGILALFYVTFRPWKRSRISQATAAELTSIYWHFMDGLWIFLFALLTLGR